ncbi:hypothetical protein AB3X26_10990 [Raoultella planticola]|uniref:hypothetical protein n=1 Tax=Raoultella planticola TaxID=575 RepID=UPI00349F680A
MTIDDAESFAFMQSIDYTSIVYPLYVINGSISMQNKAVDFSGYLIMINANGDTIAGRSPGSKWSMYPSVISGSHPNILSNRHAISIP